MTRPSAFFSAALLLAAGLVFAACETHGETRISWSFTDGPVTGAGDCSRRGVDKIVITFQDEVGASLRSFDRPCSRGDSGALTMPTGTYQVQVQAFGPSGLPFRDPFTDEITLVEYLTDVVVKDRKAETERAVIFTPNPECADGVDNDHDGLVDADDPGCLDKNGLYDPTETRTEEDPLSPGTLTVSWRLNGGRDTCAEVQPTGAATAIVLLDGQEAGAFPCGLGGGTFTATPGTYAASLRLSDAQGAILAETASQDATLVQDVTTPLAFDVAVEDFDPAQTGELQLSLSWLDAGLGCDDASPVVDTQTLVLRDDDGQVVTAATLSGVPMDGTSGLCIDDNVIQGPVAYLPAGLYTLSVTGTASTGGQCWSLVDEPLLVDIGPNALHDVVVPQIDATGLCAP